RADYVHPQGPPADPSPSCQRCGDHPRRRAEQAGKGSACDRRSHWHPGNACHGAPLGGGAMKRWWKLTGVAAPRSQDAREVLSDYIRDPRFKRLFDQVASAQARGCLKSLAVLSGYPGEGKTFLVSVLALGYATFLRRRVLILDTISQTRNESFYL